MQILINGLISGLTLSVLAAAFSAVYLPTRVFHVALGGIYAATPFFAWVMQRVGFPWPIIVVMVILIAGLLSVLCEMINHAPLARNGASSGAHLVSSLGIYLIIVQVVSMIWGNETKVLRTGIDTGFRWNGVMLARSQILAMIAASACLLGYCLWLRFSDLGLKFRALADNPVQLGLYGFNTNHLRLLSFGISGIFCAASALLVSYDIGFDPHGGLFALLLAVVAVIIGGRQSLFWGPVLGGMLLGLMRTEVVWFLSARWREAVTYLLLVLFLFFRPEGLSGKQMRLEAQA
jgi:branched-chain amino acid transport system permease protein